jgi:integrase
MATLEKRRGGYRLVFWHQSKRYQGALKADNDKDAAQLKAKVERNLQLLQEGRIAYKPGDDLFMLMLSDGKLNAPVKVAERVSLGEFLERYQANRPPSKEKNTAYTEDIHIVHLRRLLGEKTALADVNAAKLQEYINRRSQEYNRQGEPVSHVTIKKELGTLSAAWNKWGMRERLVTERLPTQNLEYPKRTEQPPFQTWEQIARQTADPESALWESLFLSVPQIEELLAHVKERGCVVRGHRRHLPWVYPMIACAAYTGARRSELLRARVGDVDFAHHELTIREKKKDRSAKETYRHVPMVPPLEAALKDWLAEHPGGDVLFCRRADEPFTQPMANHYFRYAVADSKWQVVRGWHCFRHSIISNLVADGVAERLIMEIAGHINPQTSRRYQHLRPESKQRALHVLFSHKDESSAS